MINNFQLIRPLLKFENGGDFYFVQLFKRRKDNLDMKQDMQISDNFFIYSLEELDEKEPIIIKVCQRENARAYLRLNVRNAEKVALKMLSKLAELIYSRNCKQAKSVYLSACGETNCATDKTWIVDIDDVDTYPLNLVTYLETLQKETGREPLCFKIPTKNGHHLITRPFNKQKFSNIYPEIQIHADNPTLLYCP
jgi:hypothetical protein